MVLVKNCKFFDIFISAKKRQENVFDDFLERENTFVDKKKWVTTWVLSKIGNFSIFLFQPKNDGKMCLTIF